MSILKRLWLPRSMKNGSRNREKKRRGRILAKHPELRRKNSRRFVIRQRRRGRSKRRQRSRHSKRKLERIWTMRVRRMMTSTIRPTKMTMPRIMTKTLKRMIMNTMTSMAIMVMKTTLLLPKINLKWQPKQLLPPPHPNLHLRPPPSPLKRLKKIQWRNQLHLHKPTRLRSRKKAMP